MSIPFLVYVYSFIHIIYTHLHTSDQGIHEHKTYVTGFEKIWLSNTIINNYKYFNYLKYFNLGRETDTCMKYAMILLLFIIYLFTNY